MTADVELANISKRFGEHVAVDDISFEVAQGSFFSLLGPSGCGKSTTLRMISGFEWPDAGRLEIAGRDMRGVPPNKRPTNMVFQRWALFPHMSVYDNVAFGPSVERAASADIRRRVGEALALVGLTDFAARKPGQLSGGQMQRVALARALVNQPRVLLLDEPLGALDLKLRSQMQLELKRIQKEVGTTFIYVTHDQGEAMTMSDRIAVMNRGRIEHLGSPQDIYDRPATRFVAGFIGNTNLLPVEVLAANGAAATVRAGALTFPTPAAGRPVPGKGHVSIRYERVKTGAGAQGLAVATTATVRDVIFSGSVVQYALDLPGTGTELFAEAPYDGTSPLHRQGETIPIGWDAAAPRLFQEQG